MLRVMLPAAIAAGRSIGGILPIIDVLPVGIVYKCVVVIDVDIVIPSAPVVVVPPAATPSRTHCHADTK